MFQTLELLDRDLFLFINSHHTWLFDEFMFYVSQIWIFAPVFMYWFYLIFSKYGIKKTLVFLAFLTLLIALTDQTSNRFKHAVKRYRPTHNIEIQDQVHIVHDYKGGKYSFFSGHSTSCFGVATLLFLLFNQRKQWFRLLFFLWAALTAYSRIYLGVHYPSDIFVGFLVGVLSGFVIYELLQFTFKKYYNETVSL